VKAAASKPRLDWKQRNARYKQENERIQEHTKEDINRKIITVIS